MKRSHINALIADAIRFFEQMHFTLPPFATFSLADWQTVKEDAREIFDLGLGWDITDFGSGQFEKCGLLLFTIRNGKYGSTEYSKSYAEKIMIVNEGQVTPLHFHWNKMEDIINRGGGDLVFELHQATEQEEPDQRMVQVSIDGLLRTAAAGESLALKPGQSLTLPPYLYHRFYGRGGRVLVGEVSMVNDDSADNRFHEPVGRFPEIEEDVLPEYLLCTDYKRFVLERDDRV